MIVPNKTDSCDSERVTEVNGLFAFFLTTGCCVQYFDCSVALRAVFTRIQHALDDLLFA